MASPVHPRPDHRPRMHCDGGQRSTRDNREQRERDGRPAAPRLGRMRATISGDGVSPAASAAASGSPPGSAAGELRAEAGRWRGLAFEAAQDHPLDDWIEIPARRCRRRRSRCHAVLVHATPASVVAGRTRASP